MSQASYPNDKFRAAVEQLRATVEKNLHEVFDGDSFNSMPFFVAGIKTNQGIVFKHNGKLYIDPDLSTRLGSVTADDSYEFPCEIDPGCCAVEFLSFLSRVSDGVSEGVGIAKEFRRIPLFSVFPSTEALTQDGLTNMLREFCDHYSLPFICANELLHQIEGDALEARVRKWLTGFVRRWDMVAS